MSDKVLRNLLKDRLFQMDSVSFNHFHSGVILYLSLRKIITEWFTDNHDYTLSQIAKSSRETPGKEIVSELAAISICDPKNETLRAYTCNCSSVCQKPRTFRFCS